MSMIGKLRQVSEFELAKFKKNPGEMMRALAGSTSFGGDPQMYGKLRETLQQSPMVQQLMEQSRQGKAPTPDQQKELRQQMLALLQQAQEMQRAAFGKTVPPSRPPQTSSDNELDLHKSWHCLHFLLTGEVEGSGGSPLGNAIPGGVEIGGEAADMGYGPPRALSPTQVKSVAAALEGFPIEEKAAHFDANAADKAGIYVARHEREELKQYFAELRSFYTDAANKGNAVLLWIE